MLFGKLIAAILGFFYIYFVVESYIGNVRNGWWYKSVSFSKAVIFNLSLMHDFFAGLTFLWMAFMQSSFLYGRTFLLWIAHTSMTAVLLGKFDGTDDEGDSHNWGYIGRPVLFCLAIYWYYLALLSGVSLVDVVETILDILAD